MDARIAQLYEKMQALQDQLEAELAARRADLKYRIEKNRIIFEEDILKRHAEMKTALLKYLRQAKIMNVLTAPVIYALILPLICLDVFVSLYQAICFPVYKIQKVRRRDYFVFDRAFLPYLNAVEKINCAYCSYANGLLAYAREIASRTEQYWCPIKHARRTAGTLARYADFADYGDADDFRERQTPLRNALTPPED